MKPADVKTNTCTCVDSTEEKLIGNIVRISKYKNMFAKGYVTNWSEEVFVLKKLKFCAVDICD